MITRGPDMMRTPPELFAFQDHHRELPPGTPAWFGSPGSFVAPQFFAYRVEPSTGSQSAKLSFCGAAMTWSMLARPATKQMINRRQQCAICFLSHSSCDLFAITMPGFSKHELAALSAQLSLPA